MFQSNLFSFLSVITQNFKNYLKKIFKLKIKYNNKKFLIKIKNFFQITFLKYTYIVKKYLYTVNHKKLGLSYFYFVYFTAAVGSLMATIIRLELAYPGSSVFNGDSLKYLQIISAHALIMIFFVVVPIFFGGFANFLLPYHLGCKDVAYPRLNNLGFWLQPCGFLLIMKVSVLRVEFWRKGTTVTRITDSAFDNYYLNFYKYTEFYNTLDLFFTSDYYKECEYKETSYIISILRDIYNNPNDYWILTKHSTRWQQKKRYIVKCASANQTVSGWAFITPLSSNTEYTGFGVQDMLILAIYFVGISTTISVVNLLTTRRVLTTSGLKNKRTLIPFVSISLLLMLRTLSIITPILGSAMLMLLTDRHWKTSFFDFAYGGDPIFFQHLFWFFGHPEVYVLIIPAFGIVNTVLPSVNSRRIASKHHLIWAIYVMNYMGFMVWGHHMYLVGLDHRSRAIYSTITIMISLPATIKVVNWTYSLVNGSLKNTLMLHAIVAFILFFLVAGLTGMWLSHISLNISMHDTLYVVAHFHLMLSGAVFTGIFIGYYYYYNVMYGLKISKTLSYIHIAYYTAGQWLTFIPLFWLAFSGLPRRVHDYPYVYVGWQSVATAGHFTTMIGVLAFFLAIIESKINKKTALTSANTLPRYSKRLLYIWAKLNKIKKSKKNRIYNVTNVYVKL